MGRFFFIMFLASAGFLSSARARAMNWGRPHLPVVASVDLERYLGRWYEIARLPNAFEKDDMVNITAEYDLMPSGDLSIVNSCVRGNGRVSGVGGIGRVVDPVSNSKIEVAFAPKPLRFLPFVWGNYWIIDLDFDYQWAVVGEPSRKFLWILSRQPVMSAELYNRLCASAEAKGFDTAELIKPQQKV
jgi:apolipoprotein D and lipocalin family protein